MVSVHDRSALWLLGLEWGRASWQGSCGQEAEREQSGGWDKILPSTAIFCSFAYLLLQHPSPPSSLLNWIHQWLDEARTLMTQPFLKAPCLNPTALGTKPLTQPLGNHSDHNWAQLTRMFVAQDPRPWRSLMRTIYWLLQDIKWKEIEKGSQLFTGWGPWSPHPGRSTSKPVPRPLSGQHHGQLPPI